jgi:hypothetical protein
MKRALVILGLLILLAGAASAQVPDLTGFQDTFAAFAAGMADTLPATAAAAGLSWSPAYIGQLPHFGVGLSVGAFTIPYATVQPLLAGLDIALPTELQFVQTFGLPIPAVALDARLGGILFPFDVGFKVGFIPEALRDKLGDVNADYLLLGGDIRLPLLKGDGPLPSISISGGYTYMRANVGVPDIVGAGDYALPLGGMPGFPLVYTLIFQDPDLEFAWDTHTFVGKLQASMDLLVFTPHVGLGFAYGISHAGGGLNAPILLDDGATTEPLEQSDIDYIEQTLKDNGQPVPENLSMSGVLVSSAANGPSFWVYGGTAINIFVLKVDLSAMYNFLSGAYGGAVNVRIQL